MMPLSDSLPTIECIEDTNPLVDDYDDNSSLDSEEVLELEQLQYGSSFSLDLDDESDASDDLSDFVLDISLMEKDLRLRNDCDSRRRGRRALEQEDPLETDSLKLIRKRVTEMPDRLPVHSEEAVRHLPSPVVKKLDNGSLPFQVCEVPLGVSLKDIIPSAMFWNSNFRQFPAPTQTMSSGSLLDGIDKALEIVSSHSYQTSEEPVSRISWVA